MTVTTLMWKTATFCFSQQVSHHSMKDLALLVSVEFRADASLLKTTFNVVVVIIPISTLPCTLLAADRKWRKLLLMPNKD